MGLIISVVIGIVGSFLTALGLSKGTGMAAGISDQEARTRYGSEVARYAGAARQAEAQTGIPSEVLLSVLSEESAGKEKWVTSYHPDGTSWGAMGLTGQAFEDMGEPDPRGSGYPVPEQVLDAAFYLAQLKSQEGSLYEALKWYNHGSEGGRSYATDVLKGAQRADLLPSSQAKGSTPNSEIESKEKRDEIGGVNPSLPEPQPVEPLPVDDAEDEAEEAAPDLGDNFEGQLPGPPRDERKPTDQTSDPEDEAARDPNQDEPRTPPTPSNPIIPELPVARPHPVAGPEPVAVTR